MQGNTGDQLLACYGTPVMPSRYEPLSLSMRLRIDWARCCHLDTPVSGKLTKLKTVERHIVTDNFFWYIPCRQHMLFICAMIVLAVLSGR